MIQEVVADAMAAAGWKMTRDRYSKYESGALPIGPKVYANLVAYWSSRGVTGPDLTPVDGSADPPLTEHQELVKALREQTAAINSLVGRLDSLASGAIRAGVLDALREAGVSPAGAAS